MLGLRLRENTSDPPSKAEVAQALKDHWHCEATDIRAAKSRRVWYVDWPDQKVMFRANPGWDGTTLPPLIVKYVDHLSRSGAPVPSIFPVANGDLVAHLREYTLSVESRLPGKSYRKRPLESLYELGGALGHLHNAGEVFSVFPGQKLSVEEYTEAMFERSLARLLQDDEKDAINKLRQRIRRDDGNALRVQVSWIISHGDVTAGNAVGSEEEGLWLTDFDCSVFMPALVDVVSTRIQWQMGIGGGELSNDDWGQVLQGYQSVRPLSEIEKQAWPIIWAGYCVDRRTFLLDRRRVRNQKKDSETLRTRVLNFPNDVIETGQNVLRILGPKND